MKEGKRGRFVCRGKRSNVKASKQTFKGVNHRKLNSDLKYEIQGGPNGKG
jgi:hypothetical protein